MPSLVAGSAGSAASASSIARAPAAGDTRVMADLFSGTWVLVTGASSGLGESFSRQLAARRANLVLTARRREQLENLAAELRAAHGIATEVISADLAAPGGAAELCGEVDRRQLAVRHVISNAGFGFNGAVMEGGAARLADMVRLNCEALTFLTAHFLPLLVAAREGGVIHVGSIAGMQPVPFMAVYGASKAFVNSFSVAVAEEVRGTGVRVMALCPGPVPTGFQRAAGSGIAPGQRAAVLSADETVARALAAYERGETQYVPGVMNRIQLLGSRLAPRALTLRVVARMMRAKQRVE